MQLAKAHDRTTCGATAILCVLVAAATLSGQARAVTPSEATPAPAPADDAAADDNDDNADDGDDDAEAFRAAAAATGIGAVALVFGIVTCVGAPLLAYALVPDAAPYIQYAAPSLGSLVTAGGYAVADAASDGIHHRADDATPDTTRRFAMGTLLAAPSFFVGIPVGAVAGCSTGAALGVPVVTWDLICVPTVTDAGYIAAGIGGLAGAFVTAAVAAAVIPGMAEEWVGRLEPPFQRREGEPPARSPSSPLQTMRW